MGWSDIPAEIRAVRLLTRWHFLKRRKGGLPTGANRLAYDVGRHWGWSDNILGLAAAWKTVNGKRSKDQLAVTIYVRRKSAKARLARESRIPERLVLPGYPVDVVTDVVALKQAPVAQADFPRVRPVQPGSQVAHLHGVAGTLCCVVTREGESGHFGLGCSHVLAREGRAREDEEVEQPSNSLLDPPEDRIGKLTRGFTVLKFQGETNTSDHALVKLAVGARPAIFPAGVIPAAVSAVDPPGLVHRRARLHGSRTQNAPTCRIGGVEAALRVEFRHGVARMAGLVAYDTPCQAGDSGGPVLDAETGELLGMHIAGIVGERKGFFLPVKKLFADLKLTLVTA